MMSDFIKVPQGTISRPHDRDKVVVANEPIKSAS